MIRTLSILLLLALCLPSLAQRSNLHSIPTRKIVSRLEHDIPQLMSKAEIPGLSIALIRDGKTTWSHGFGVTNADTKQPVDDNTIFEAASLSNWRPRGDNSLKILFTPGDRFSYSGEGFVYLSRVVEHITGEPLSEFMKSAVFDPLGMSSSSYVWRDDYDTRKTFAHNSVGAVSGRGKPEKANAAASLHTTARDYARFVCEIINGRDAVSNGSLSRKTDNAQAAPAGLMVSTRKVVHDPALTAGLTPAMVSLMLTPQIRVPEDRSTPNSPLSSSLSWGLGWGLERTAAGTSFWHWGDNGDAKAFVLASPAAKSGVVFFANSANGLSIIQELVAGALSAQHPATAWINYEGYNSPARLMFKAILASDAETVLGEYRQRRQPPISAGGQASPAAANQSSSSNKSRDERPKSRNLEKALTEGQMNSLGYQLLGLKRVKDAIEVFKQNTVDFPNAFNTWDSLAEAYMVSGDKESAIKYYKKSLELNSDNTNAVQKLKELGR